MNTWQPYHLSNINDEAAVQPTLGHQLIYPGLRHVFSGPQESAKTLAAYAIGIDIIRNHPNRVILLLDFEMGPRAAKRRWRDCGATDHELEHNILYLAPEQPANPERIAALVTLQPLLVIIDAAAGAFDNQELDDNKRQDAEKWRKLYVDPFFDAGIATLVLDHVVKNTETRGKYSIGSERKTGGGEVHIGFDTIKPIRRGSSGLYKMILHKDREGHHHRGHFHDLHVTSDPLTHTISFDFWPVAELEDGQIQRPTELMERVSHYLEAQDEPVTRNQIVLHVKGNAEYVRKAIDHLVDLEYVQEAAGSNRARLYTAHRPFIRSEWENKLQTQVRPSSSQVRPDELTTGSSVRPPPKGDERTGATNGTPKFVQDDPEVLEMLRHYDLLAGPEDNEDPPIKIPF